MDAHDRGSVLDETFVTEDEGEAEALLRRVYPEVTIRETDTPFRFVRTVRGVPRFALVRLRITSTATFTASSGSAAAFGTVASGGFTGTVDGIAVDTTRAFVLPPGEIRAVAADTDLTLLTIDRSVLADGPEPGAAAPAPVFHGREPVSRRLEQAWHSVLRMTQSVLGDPELLRNELVVSTTMDAVRSAAMLAFPIEVPHEPVEPPSRRAVERARDFIHGNAGLPISMADIAAAAGVTMHSLQAGFRRDLGTSPTAYLQRERLERARADLRASERRERTVADVARRWSFHHPERFASAYRQAYGVHPAEEPRD